jgi:hypothetical protein
MIGCGGHREREGVGRADVRGHGAAAGLVGCERRGCRLAVREQGAELGDGGNPARVSAEIASPGGLPARGRWATTGEQGRVGGLEPGRGQESLLIWDALTSITL